MSGVLIQEQIVNKLKQEGYVPALTLDTGEEEEEMGGVGNAFEVSDDESDDELDEYD
jgi:hypothetical protein